MLLDELFLSWLALPDTQRLACACHSASVASHARLRCYHSSTTRRLAVQWASKAYAWRSPLTQGPPCQRRVNSTVASSVLSPLCALWILQPPLSPQKGTAHRHPLADGSPPLSPRRASLHHAAAAAAAAAAVHRAVIPQFYRPAGERVKSEHASALASQLGELFACGSAGSLSRVQFGAVTRSIVELPSMFSGVLFDRLVGSDGKLSRATFDEFWHAHLAAADTPQRAFEVLRREGSTCLEHGDVKPLLLELLSSHPGLDFLREAPEFQARYVETVVYRIFYGCARADPRRITARELRRSDLLEAMFAVDECDDINRVLRYFSYEHFYVIYCRFWELDADHDFLLDREDVLRYGGHALTYRIVDRVFAGAGRPLTSGVPGRMGYEDFVWFCLSEEDKTTHAALAYWFRCLDLDGDGVITAAEAGFFYEEQLQRMECLAQEPVAFEDVMCQLTDMLSPAQPGRITLADLRACRLAGQFFNVLFNLGKFVAHEARDPFTIRAEREDPGLTEWDRFARLEYSRLSNEEEEGAQEGENWERE